VLVAGGSRSRSRRAPKDSSRQTLLNPGSPVSEDFFRPPAPVTAAERGS